MKKIYNYLFPVFLSLFAVAACDEDNEEIVQMTYENPCAIVTGISPVRGYVDTEFTISGEDFGVRTDDVKVYIGSQEASVISCEDKAIVAKVPVSATDGKITVEVFGQRVETDLSYSVLGKPGISAVKPSFGFPGMDIVFEGHDLGVSKTLYTLLFVGCTDKAEIIGTPTDERFQVKLPESAESGIMTLKISNQAVDLASYPFTVLKHATLDLPKQDEPVPSGYAGSTFTITGTNLDQELLKPVEGLQPLRVTFTAKEGGDPVQAVIDVDKLTDKSITVTVPETLIAGDYVVTVITPFETIESTLAYTVLPMPEVTGISISAGYINAEVTIKGNNFGSKAEDIQVVFGEIPVDKVILNNEGHIVVNVPKVSQTGRNVIKLTIKGMEIPMENYEVFEVWETPQINVIETAYMFPYGTLAKAGEEIVLSGSGFGTEAESVTVYFEGVVAPVEVNNITETQIKVTVPEGFNGGKLTLSFKNIDEPIETEELAVMPEDGDITQYALNNSLRPFKLEQISGTIGTAAGWMVNEEAKNCKKISGGNGNIQNANDDAKCTLAVQAGWDYNNIINGKIY